MKSKGFLRSTSLLALLFIVSLTRSDSSAQSNPTTRINPELLTKVWSARWINVPNTSPFDYGVYHFRRIFELPARPSSFVIHVTGDNRYQLYVNGERILWG
ncbi:MAG TPA: glycoside hydrolase, partial [Blastocatellia bacterium]|nr:glycoside hydrolase [Blastocatellia bacterium]